MEDFDQRIVDSCTSTIGSFDEDEADDRLFRCLKLRGD